MSKNCNELIEALKKEPLLAPVNVEIYSKNDNKKSSRYKLLIGAKDLTKIIRLVDNEVVDLDGGFRRINVNDIIEMIVESIKYGKKDFCFGYHGSIDFINHHQESGQMVVYLHVR